MSKIEQLKDYLKPKKEIWLYEDGDEITQEEIELMRKELSLRERKLKLEEEKLQNLKDQILNVNVNIIDSPIKTLILKQLFEWSDF